MSPEPRHAYLKTPIGVLEVMEVEGTIVRADFVDHPGETSGGSSPILDACRAQLEEYFEGRRREFDLELNPIGTAFQRRVWDELLKIPYGRTSTYGRIAALVGNGRAVRAVGAANGRNPISIIIPCHRVVGSDGSLVGYGGGLWRKEWLLRHECEAAAPLR
jgi:methylated-DNA-[protein]-cysteine S-methyltransferase